MPSPLEITNIHKAFLDKRVLNAIHLSLVPGEIFGLIGLNGAGKTTLIKIILDLISADQGDVTMFGNPTNDTAARDQLSYLPEKFQPSRYLKGMEYLSLSLSYYGKKLDPVHARLQAEKFDLSPAALDIRVGAYSKGMGQKLGLLGAFMVDTPLLILDEPMSGLDPSARIKLKEQLLSAKREGKTVFFSSHILSDIDEICDRIGIIHNGTLKHVGTPGAFKQHSSETSLEKAFLSVVAA